MGITIRNPRATQMTTFSQVSALHVNVEPDPCNPMCFAYVLAHRVYGTKFESMHQAIESMHQAIESMHQAFESIGIRGYTGDHFYLTLLHFTYFFSLNTVIPYFVVTLHPAQSKTYSHRMTMLPHKTLKDNIMKQNIKG